MHTFKRVNDTCYEVGYYRPPVQGMPHNVWYPLVAFSDIRLASAVVSALNGGGCDQAFTEAAWYTLNSKTMPVITPADPVTIEQPIVVEQQP